MILRAADWKASRFIKYAPKIFVWYMKRDFYLYEYTILNRIQLTKWTICAFRVLNPCQWSLAKQSISKSFLFELFRTVYPRNYKEHSESSVLNGHGSESMDHFVILWDKWNLMLNMREWIIQASNFRKNGYFFSKRLTTVTFGRLLVLSSQVVMRASPCSKHNILYEYQWINTCFLLLFN